MEANGSPVHVFGTDEQTYVLVTLPVHALAGGHTSNQVNNLIFTQLEIF